MAESPSTQIVTLTINPAVDISTSVKRMMPFTKMGCAPAHRDPGGGGINVARVEPASVSGAGDSFLGAMVWSLVSDGRLDMALLYGVAGGSAALFNPGGRRRDCLVNHHGYEGATNRSDGNR